MKLKLYQVDAFTNKVFSGNPAAVCPLIEWLPDQVMQNIALENNLAETAFYVKQGSDYHIRWFTPTVEVDLCGHATLASAHVLFHHDKFNGDSINFHSARNGNLKVFKKDDLLTLDFPADIIQKIDWPEENNEGFNITPLEAYRGKTDFLLVFENENQIKNLKPNLAVIEQWKIRGAIVTAKGNNVDFVSRFFAPQSGVNEDPVTGSAHTTLTPFWSQRLNKTEMTAMQLSARTGKLVCEVSGDRIHISGNAVTYLIGDIEV
jgi:PhzF family phenazine biosynthesis protein